MSTANIRARLGLDSMPYKAGARDVRRQNADIKRSIHQIGAAIGVSFGIAAITRGARSLAEYATQASIAARNMGLLTHEVVALNRVGKASGVESGQMARMLGRMQTELAKAAEGSAEAQKKFESMGVSIDALIGMNPAEMLQAVASAAVATGNPIAALSDLFGERLGPTAVAALRDISENGLPDVDEALGVTMDRMEAVGTAWNRLIDGAKEFGITAVFWVDQVGKSIGEYLFGVMDNLTERFKIIGLVAKGRWQEAGERSAGLKGINQAGREAQWEGIDRREQEMQERIGKRKKEQVDAIASVQRTRSEALANADEKAETDKATAVMSRLEKEREAIERMQRSRKDGEERIRADFLAAYNAIIKDWHATESQELRRVFSERAELLSEHYKQDVYLFRAAEAEKTQRERDRIQGDLDKLHERLESEKASATGAGIMADQLARVGAFMGGERAGLAQADKQLRIAEISERHLFDIAAKISEIADHDARQSGGGI